MLRTKSNYGVSEIIGTMLLLVIAVAVFSFVYISVTTNLSPNTDTLVDITGKIENGKIILNHVGGEQLGPDTKILLTIGDFELIPFTVEEKYLDGNLTNSIDEYWDIGEEIEYEFEDPTIINESGPKIDIKVVDNTTNSLKLLGVIQEGYTLTYGKGGIWHFDEDNGVIAEDASGNHNNGTLGWFNRSGNFKQKSFFGPDWTNDTVIGKNAALNFTGGIDLVRVSDSWSLDIENNITIEAWVIPKVWFGVDNIDFSDAFGYDPHIIRVYNTTYAIAHVEKGKGGIVKTVNISEGGLIFDDINNNTILFSGSINTENPKITHVSGNNYVISYCTNNNHAGYMSSIEIAITGVVNDLVNDTVCFELNYCEDPDIIRINNNICAIAYHGEDDDGFLKTYNIANDGDISNTHIDELEFDNKNCLNPKIRQIYDNIYAIVYTGEGNDGFIKTFEIKNDGTINNSNYIDSFEFDTNDAYWPDIIQINDTIYAITYNDNSIGGGDGLIRTIEIKNDGDIINSVIDQMIFENNICLQTNLSYILESYFIVAYEGKNQDGYLVTINISSDGDIIELMGTPKKFNPDKNIYGNVTQGHEPCLIKISDYVYAIAYRDQTAHPGALLTVLTSENIISPRNKGIVKQGSYGIYANYTHKYGVINGELISSNTLGWGHLALTFDGNNMRLYFNGSLIETKPFSPVEGIRKTNTNLFFGYLYNGLIDEIAIFDIALTEEQINDHMNNTPSPLT